MTQNSRRPFYAEYAWAFDLLIDRPVRKECTTMASWLVERGVLPGAELLDAGCGTGRYARELARRGYIVQGIDSSEELIDVARRSIGEAPGAVSFAVGDIQQQPAGRYDAILCRGVLNDVVEDDVREGVLKTFGWALRPSGVLILDVREWEASALRKDREPIFRKSVDTDRGRLTFTSVTELDSAEPPPSLVRAACSGRRKSRTFQRLPVRDAMLDARGAGVRSRKRWLR